MSLLKSCEFLDGFLTGTFSTKKLVLVEDLWSTYWLKGVWSTYWLKGVWSTYWLKGRSGQVAKL